MTSDYPQRQPIVPAGGAYPSTLIAWWSVAILCLAAAMSVIDRSILTLVVDPVRRDLGLSDVQISLLQGLAFGVFYAIAGVPLGLLSDRVSRRMLIAVGVLVWSLATIGGGLAHSFGVFFTSRLVVGLGEAALGPAAVSLIIDMFPPSRRGWPLSMYLAGQALANGLAISITGLLTTAVAQGRFAGMPIVVGMAPWRAPFILCGAGGLLIALLVLTVLEPGRRRIPSRAGDLGLSGDICFLKRNAAVVLPLYLGFAFCFMAACGSSAWAPTMLIRSYHLNPVTLALWLGPLSMVFSVFGPLASGFLLDRYARNVQNIANFRILMIAPCLAMPAALAVFAPNPICAMVLVASSSGIFAAVGTAVLVTLQMIAPADLRGSATAMTGLFNTFIGGCLGPFAVAGMTEYGFRDPARVGHAIALVALPALLAAVVLFALARRNMIMLDWKSSWEP